jgi:hypothetical protein
MKGAELALCAFLSKVCLDSLINFSMDKFPLSQEHSHRSNIPHGWSQDLYQEALLVVV